MKRKAVSLLLAALTCTTVLTGCGGQGSTKSNSGKSSKETSSTAEDTVDENGKVNGLMNSEGLPLVDKEGDYKFSIFVDSSNESDDFYMLNEFKKQTNVDVELRRFPYETATERLNLDLNSGDYADVIGGWTLNDSMILTYGVQQGVFIPLEDIFKKYCPNIEKVLDLPGVREQMTAPDGHIYGIPYVTGDSTVGYSPWINERWLKNVNKEMPKTTDEFEDVLKAFKDQDANGNGDVNDEIPFSTDPNNKHIEAMTGYFGLPMNKFGVAIQGDKVVYGGAGKKYRKFLSWFHKLFKEGLIDTELFTQDSATWEGKGNKDLYGTSIAYGSNEFSGIVMDDPTQKSEFSALPVLNTDKDGIWLRDTDGFSTFRTQAVITDNAKHPEIICRWFDNAFELENGIGCNKGPVGVDVIKEGDDYVIKDISSLPEDEQEKLSWGNLWIQELPKYLPADFEFKEENPAYDEKKALEEQYEPDLTKDIITENWIPLDDIDRYSDISTALNDYFNQQQAMFVMGEQDVDDDAQWQSYVDGLKSLGLEDWVKMRGLDGIAK